MFKSLRLSSILFAVIFVLSISAAQACVVMPGKPCCSEPCKDEACPMKEAKAKLIKVACGLCKDTEESGKAEDVAQHAADLVLNIKGMTCAGCEGRVKDALSTCKGVKDAQVSHKDGKAFVQVEGNANKEELIKAVEKVGFSASEG